LPPACSPPAPRPWQPSATALTGLHRALRLARTLNDALKDMPPPRPPGCRSPSCPRPQEVTTMTMTEPRFPVRITRGVPVVIAPEQIDITNAAALRAALLHAAARPGPALVVDMTGTRFCDSAGLHALIGAHKRAQAEGRQVRLAVTGAQVRRILALTALDRLIPVCTSLDQAFAHPAAAPSRAAREQGR
jgi:anti-sigma B factor antagonist